MHDRKAMLAAMKKEIALRQEYLRTTEKRTGKISIETLYFGGGTPSALSIDELEELLETVEQYYTFVSGAEITLEANPDDLTDRYLADLSHLGFNRLSIGIQSFYDDDLQWMNRRHHAEEAKQSVKAARRHGFQNINIDLIYGLPSMTHDRLKSNLQQAITLDVPHLSAYHLTIEPRTVFGRRQAKGELFTIHEDESAGQFDTLLDFMEKSGYEHYEISNFARSGYRSRHNSAYWQQRTYIGIGPAAHSYDGQSRQWNINNNSKYIAALENTFLDEGDDIQEISTWYEREQLTVTDQYNDYILISIRTAEGADVNYIRQYFGDDFADTFLKQAATYISNGYIQERAGVFTLTRKGKLVADRIAADLFQEAVY